jgi:hypothetical protein
MFVLTNYEFLRNQYFISQKNSCLIFFFVEKIENFLKII